jgi:iron complex outermembrane receptor protein
MVPGVNVARIDSNKWAVSIRGSSGRFANKLLVQIDGRTVYTPLFGGVFWDVQDVVFEDVERIEVVRGPGATVWGANAVNGIINIITKRTADTQGIYAQAGGGTEELGFAAARYGSRVGSNLNYRLYGKWFERDQGYLPAGDANDQWHVARGGFRADWTPDSCDTVTVQGDYYGGESDQRNLYPSGALPFYQVINDQQPVRGGNVLFRWRRELAEDSDWSLQMYYDRTEREWFTAGLAEDRDTLDIDFQHRFPLGCRHSMIWGFGYRNTKDRIHNTDLVVGNQPIIAFSPGQRALDLFSYFLQDEITLSDDLLYFTVGSKFEHNDFTGFEFQPTARLLWTPTRRHSIWASVSRAVRIPTRAEDDIRILLPPVGAVPPGIPVFPEVVGNRGIVAEEVMAYEAGIRVQPTDKLFWDLAVFFNDYDNVRSVDVAAFPIPSPGGFFVIPGEFGNSHRFQSYGFEVASTYNVNACWRLYGAYSFLVQTDTIGGDMASPRNQIYLQSSWDLTPDVHCDVMWRYVDSLEGFQFNDTLLPGVSSYNAMDVRLAWDVRPGLELAVVGRNLLDLAHPEAAPDFFLGNAGTEVQSEVYGTVTWRY